MKQANGSSNPDGIGVVIGGGGGGVSVPPSVTTPTKVDSGINTAVSTQASAPKAIPEQNESVTGKPTPNTEAASKEADTGFDPAQPSITTTTTGPPPATTATHTSSSPDPEAAAPRLCHPTFRAVIVGGGPGGLCMAHMLERAGIDWVILERSSEVVKESGASVAIWPQNGRVLDQCGILDEAERLFIPIRNKINLGPDGSVLATSNMLERIHQNFGYPWMLFHRKTLLEFLHGTLPGREGRVLVNKAVTGIESTSAGVRVRCSDGTSVHGSIVIGCDGVHSKVRKLMRDPATYPDPGAKPLRTPDNAMSAVFCGLVGHFPRLKKIPAETALETHDSGMCVQMLVGQDDAYFFVYKRLARPAPQGPPTYTEADMEALAAEVAGIRVASDGVTFADVWAARTQAAMVNYEEGVASEWHHGRVVLVSDACVKMTPNAAFGLNTGMQGMVDLTNRLRALLVGDARDRDPTEAEIRRLFEGYQGSRERMAKNIQMFSKSYTRTVTWANLGYRFMDWLAPRIGGDRAIIDTMVSSLVKRSIVLDFAEEKAYREGRVPWRNGRVGEDGADAPMRLRDSCHAMGYGVPA